MTDDTHDTGHRDGGAVEPPLLSRRELRRRQQEMERGSAEASGDAHRWVDPFPAVPRTSEGGLFGPDRVRPGSPADAPADDTSSADDEADGIDDLAPGAPEDTFADTEDTRTDDVEVVGTHAFDELFVEDEREAEVDAAEDADDDAEDLPAGGSAPDGSAAPAAPSAFDAVVAPAVGSTWSVPAPHVVNAHPFRMPLRPSSEVEQA
ncbi:ATPase, partial [Clavibacter lycopersici]